jgi:hypothetical protein
MNVGGLDFQGLMFAEIYQYFKKKGERHFQTIEIIT